MNKLAIATIVAMMASTQVWAIQGTISTANDTKKGEIKWQARTKSYLLTMKKGKTDVSAEYPIDTVTALDIPVPPGYEKAVEMVQSGNGKAAIAPLTKIVQDYKMLVWDKPAGRYLVEAYIAAGQAQKAYDTATGIIAEDKSAAWTGDLAPAYWQALLQLGKMPQLENCLRKAASSGDRASSAYALVMRGDMLLAAGGDSQDVYRQALTDAYLRVALMYNDEPCRDARRMAMNKAAQCFEKIGMAARAEGMRTQAKAL
ncbi:MAG: hypothetical protein J6W80_02235 [Kiritimatiellae bacterium]|nr:hypothetical protein [Kiritimatiellia bacterium]